MILSISNGPDGRPSAVRGTIGRAVRFVFALYVALTFAGIALYLAVGLTVTPA